MSTRNPCLIIGETLKNRRLRDPRKHAAQTQTRMVIGLFGLCLTLGLGLIGWFYGSNAALLGLLCLAGGVLVVLIIILILHLVERVS